MIINLTRKKRLANSFEICISALSKARGLMFRTKPKTLIFLFNPPQRVSLHMWFVFFPIDIVGLDSRKRVVCLKQCFRPFTLYKTEVPCKYIVELPKGAIKKSNTKIGDFLQFEA